MYVCITDFSLQYQRPEKTGTELGTAGRCRCRASMPLGRRGRSHTNWRDRPMACMAVAVCARPRPGGAGPRPRASALGASACQGAPSPLRRQRVAALRDAGAWAVSAQPWHTRPSSTRSMRRVALVGGLCMPGCTRLRLGAPAGAAMAYTFRPGEGCAGRLTSGRGVARQLAALALANRPGLGVPATPSVRGGGSGR